MRTAGFVLAGGRSSRMGTDKALLQRGGRTLLDLAVAKLRSTGFSVSVVGDPALYGALGFSVVADVYPGCGPVGGIHAVLLNTEAPWNVVLGCDMPLVPEALLRRLRNETEAGGAAVIVPIDESGRRQPLAAAYHQDCLPALERALGEKRLRLLSVLDEFMVREIGPWPSAAFRSANTPDDWAALQKEAF